MTLKDPLDVYICTEDNFKKSNTLKVRHDSEPDTVAHGCSLSYLET